MNRVAANLPARRSSSSDEITVEPDALQAFIDDVGRVVTSTDDEHEITKRVAKRLSDLLAGEALWEPGQVTVCCTTDDDVHAVAAVGNEPTVGIHVYGGNIGTIRGRSYDPATGEARWFVSGWDSPEAATPQVRSNL